MNANMNQSLSTWALAVALGFTAAAPLAAEDVIYTYAPLGGGGTDIVRNNHGQLMMLTNSPGIDAEFTQSPDGMLIIFMSERTGRPQLHSMGPDGSNPVNISNNQSDESQPLFSPNGERVSFVSQASGDGASIYTFDPSGLNRLRLTNSGPTFAYSRPRVSPNGMLRIFNCRNLQDDSQAIIIQNADGSNTRLLVPVSGVETSNGEWSPDGSQVIFQYTQTSDLSHGIGRVNANGSGVMLQPPTSHGLKPERRRRLGLSGKSQQTPQGDRNPVWADNGQKVIYVTDVDGDDEIYIMNADGSGQTNLTNNPANDSSPVWSQDAGAILFISDRAGNDDVFLMNADGGGQKNVTNSDGDESEPQFFISPPPPDPPSIAEGGVVMANLLPTVNQVSPRSIISVFGSNFSTGTTLFPTLDDNGDLDRILDGTCLEMNGERLPIFAVTPGQINAQASDIQALGPASFTVITDCGTPNALRSETVRAATSGVEMATVEEATPVFFIFDPVAADGNIAARFNASESQAPVPVAPANAFPNDSFGPSRPAKPGDIVLLYGTGWGETEPSYAAGELAAGAAQVLPAANATVTFGGVVMDPADVLYVGVTPNAAGLYQLAIRIPANAQAGDNEVVLTVYGKSTPTGPIIPVMAP